LKHVKLLEKDIGEKLYDTGLHNDFFGYDPKIIGNKKQNRQMGLHQTKKLLHSKGNIQQNVETTYKLKEYICIPHMR
jgi:hypothetical protein